MGKNQTKNKKWGILNMIPKFKQKNRYVQGWCLTDPEEIKKKIISNEILTIDRPNIVEAFSEIVYGEMGMNKNRPHLGYTESFDRVVGKLKGDENIYVALDYRVIMGGYVYLIFFDDKKDKTDYDIRGTTVTLMTNSIAAKIDVVSECFDQEYDPEEYEINERILRYVERFVEETLKPKVLETNDRIKNEGRLELRDGFGIKITYNQDND